MSALLTDATGAANAVPNFADEPTLRTVTVWATANNDQGTVQRQVVAAAGP